MNPQEPRARLDRSFALCESCFWIATVLDTSNHNRMLCPSCSRKNLALIPLAANESYSYEFSEDGGVDVCFRVIGCYPPR